MINKRLFGSTINPQVKQRLELRQIFAEDAKPLEAITEYYEKYGDDAIYSGVSEVSKNFKGIADLSSRTPFARMWCAVDLVKLGILLLKNQKK